MVALTLIALAFGAWFTDTVGIHSVFGAFILGAAIPRGLLTRELQRLDRAGDHGAAGAAVLRLLGPQLAGSGW